MDFQWMLLNLVQLGVAGCPLSPDSFSPSSNPVVTANLSRMYCGVCQSSYRCTTASSEHTKGLRCCSWVHSYPAAATIYAYRCTRMSSERRYGNSWQAQSCLRAPVMLAPISTLAVAATDK